MNHALEHPRLSLELGCVRYRDVLSPQALPRGVERTFDLVKVRRFEADPQKTLNAAGVWASLKRIDGETSQGPAGAARDCGTP